MYPSDMLSGRFRGSLRIEFVNQGFKINVYLIEISSIK